MTSILQSSRLSSRKIDQGPVHGLWVKLMRIPDSLLRVSHPSNETLITIDHSMTPDKPKLVHSRDRAGSACGRYQLVRLVSSTTPFTNAPNGPYHSRAFVVGWKSGLASKAASP